MLVLVVLAVIIWRYISALKHSHPPPLLTVPPKLLTGTEWMIWPAELLFFCCRNLTPTFAFSMSLSHCVAGIPISSHTILFLLYMCFLNLVQQTAWSYFCLLTAKHSYPKYVYLEISSIVFDGTSFWVDLFRNGVETWPKRILLFNRKLSHLSLDNTESRNLNCHYDMPV